MITITATDKYLQINRNRIYITYFIGLSSVLLLYIFLYKDITSLLTPIACFTVILFILVNPAKTAELTLDTDMQTLNFNEETIDLSNCYAWSMNDLDDQIEIMIRRNNPIRPYSYYYIDSSDTKISEFVVQMSQVLNYEEEMQDKFQYWMRKFNFR